MSPCQSTLLKVAALVVLIIVWCATVNNCSESEPGEDGSSDTDKVSAPVYGFAVSRDSNLLATISTYGVHPGITLRELSTRKRIDHLKYRDAVPIDVQFHPRRRWLFAAYADGSVVRWDLEREERTPLLLGYHKGVLSITISRNGTVAATSGGDGAIVVWDAISGTRKETLQVGGKVRCVEFSPDGRLILAAGALRDTDLWSVATGERVGSLKTRNRQIIAASFSPDGRWIATGDLRGRLNLWRVDGRQQVWSRDISHDPLTCVRFTRDDSQVIVGMFSGDIEFRDVHSGLRRRTFRAHSGTVTRLFVTADGNLYSSSQSGDVSFWELAGD